MATEYIDRDDAVIDREKWKELRSDAAYCSVKRYDNGTVNLEVEWWGKVDNAQNLFDAYKGVYKVKVSNYTEDGKLHPDGANGCTMHRSEAEAVKHYEEFLLQWTESHAKGGKFIEEGNTLKPLNPDLPESEIMTPDGGGSAW